MTLNFYVTFSLIGLRFSFDSIISINHLTYISFSSLSTKVKNSNSIEPMQSLSNLNKQLTQNIGPNLIAQNIRDRKYSYGSHVPKMGITLGKKMSVPARHPHHNTINTICTPRMLHKVSSNPVPSRLDPEFVRNSVHNRSVGNVYITGRGRSMDRGI